MRKGLSILLQADALAILAGGMFGPLYAVFVEEIGGDLLTAGEAFAVFAFVMAGLMFIISRWGDHAKHKEFLIVLSYGLGCLGFLGYLLISRPMHLFIVQIIFGVSGAIGWPTYDGLFSKFLDKGKFISEWGLWGTMRNVMLGLGALAGGFIAKNFGFSFLFGVMLIVSLIGFFVSLLLILERDTLYRESKWGS